MNWTNLKNNWRTFKTYRATRSFESFNFTMTGHRTTHRFTYDRSKPIMHTLRTRFSGVMVGWGLLMSFNLGIVCAITGLLSGFHGWFWYIIIPYAPLSGFGMLSYTIKEGLMKPQAREYHAGSCYVIEYPSVLALLRSR